MQQGSPAGAGGRGRGWGQVEQKIKIIRPQLRLSQSSKCCVSGIYWAGRWLTGPGKEPGGAKQLTCCGVVTLAHYNIILFSFADIKG